MWFEFSYIVSFTTEVANDKTKFSNPINRIYSLYPLVERTHPKVYGRTPPPPKGGTLKCKGEKRPFISTSGDERVRRYARMVIGLFATQCRFSIVGSIPTISLLDLIFQWTQERYKTRFLNTKREGLKLILSMRGQKYITNLKKASFKN